MSFALFAPQRCVTRLARGHRVVPAVHHVLCCPQVIVLDNFFTGTHENIAQHMGKTNFEFIRHDVVQPILLEARSGAFLTQR